MARRRSTVTTRPARAAFRALPREASEGVERALIKSGREMARVARSLAPERSGDLAASVDVEVDRTPQGGALVAVEVVAGGPDQRSAIKARAQEGGRDPGPGGHPGHAAQPFMTPAYYLTRKRVRNRLRRAMRKAAKAAARRGR